MIYYRIERTIISTTIVTTTLSRMIYYRIERITPPTAPKRAARMIYYRIERNHQKTGGGDGRENPDDLL